MPGTVILVVDFSLSVLEIYPAIPFWPAVSAERSYVKHMGFPLYVTCCFSLDAFNILSLCLVFGSFISMYLGVFFLGLSCKGLFVPLELIDYFLFHVGEIFNYSLFKNFLMSFLFFPLLGPLYFKCWCV